VNILEGQRLVLGDQSLGVLFVMRDRHIDRWCIAVELQTIEYCNLELFNIYT
jgi:hypothetical protein